MQFKFSFHICYNVWICSLLFSCFLHQESRAERPPNVILVLVDDMGWMDLTTQGSDFYRTPNIDRLAKEGIRFTDGYAACAVCSPTRAAVQTGRYPHRLGITDWIRSRFQRGGKLESRKNQPSTLRKRTTNYFARPIPFGWKVRKLQLVRL